MEPGRYPSKHVVLFVWTPLPVSDSRGQNSLGSGRPRLEIDFLRLARADLARMRGLVPELEGGDAAAWSRACMLAHDMAAGANTHRFCVLTACARELDQLLCERTPDAQPDAFLMSCIASAIEAVALEVEVLMREG